MLRRTVRRAERIRFARAERARAYDVIVPVVVFFRHAAGDRHAGHDATQLRLDGSGNRAVARAVGQRVKGDDRRTGRGALGDDKGADEGRKG